MSSGQSAPVRPEARRAKAQPDSRSKAARSTSGARSGRLALQILGVAAVGACVLVNVVDPYSGVTASQYFTVSISDASALPTQSLATTTDIEAAVFRDVYSVTTPPPPPAKPSILTPDPGSAQAYALTAVTSRGWGENEFECLVSLWNRESGWRVNAFNAGSGAYGIPQALPGDKMASIAPDWQTNAATQIEWGLNYIAGRYQSPCGAWGHSESYNWY